MSFGSAFHVDCHRHLLTFEQRGGYYDVTDVENLEFIRISACACTKSFNDTFTRRELTRYQHSICAISIRYESLTYREEK